MCSLTPDFYSLMLLFFPSFILLKWFHTQVGRKEALPPGRVYLHFIFFFLYLWLLCKENVPFIFIYLFILMLGKIEGQRRRERQGMGWLGSITALMDSANSGRKWRAEEPGMLQSMGSQRVGLDLPTEQQHLYILSFVYVNIDLWIFILFTGL